jgi:hypothetical protein
MKPFNTAAPLAAALHHLRSLNIGTDEVAALKEENRGTN